MIDHVSLQVGDLAASRAWYEAVLEPLGGRVFRADEDMVGFLGDHGPSFFFIGAAVDPPGREVHVAFTAPDRATVDAFYATALRVGAESLHAPREFPEYHPGYYGAFVRDPDGNNVEAVCHR